MEAAGMGPGSPGDPSGGPGGPDPGEEPPKSN